MPQDTPSRTVRCPGCGGPSLYHPDNRHRPFCSARCQGLDLGAWAAEQFVLPDPDTPSESAAGGPDEIKH